MLYIKSKLQSLHPPNRLTTGIMIKESGGGKIKPVEATTIDEVLNCVTFKSKVKCFVTPSKLWYNNSCGESSYGINFANVKCFPKHPEQPQEQLNITNLHKHCVESEDEYVERD